MKINNLLLLLFTLFVRGMCNVYKRAAVTANGITCARVGINIMKRGGSVADAAIATLLCDGVACGERLGLGGGFMLVHYEHRMKRVSALIAREVAPVNATRNMFHQNRFSSLYGGLAVAVPGELIGYWELHKKFGKLPWAELFTEAIKLCDEGIEAAPFVKKCLEEYRILVMNAPSLRKIYCNFCNTFAGKKPRIYRPQLARTLEIIAKEGPKAIYDGVLTDDFIKDIQDNGGILTKEDLRNYKPEWVEPLKIELDDDLTYYSLPPPGSGAIIALILKIMQELLPVPNKEMLWQYLIETFKYSYAYRTRLSDSLTNSSMHETVEEMLSGHTINKITENIRNMDSTSDEYSHYGIYFMENEDAGTAHLNFIHPNGDAIAVTSSLNSLFGAMFRSESTGIILNNHMNDFAFSYANNKYGLVPAPLNFIYPGKRPMSSISPIIILDNVGNVELMIGAAGGPKIITSICTVLIQYLLQKSNIDKAIYESRLHHQLFPMILSYENDFSTDILRYLEALGHIVEVQQTTSCVSSIVRTNLGYLKASCDYRRSYSMDGF